MVGFPPTATSAKRCDRLWGQPQWLAKDALPRRVIGPPLIAKVKAEWSYTCTNLVCSGVARVFWCPGRAVTVASTTRNYGFQKRKYLLNILLFGSVI